MSKSKRSKKGEIRSGKQRVASLLISIFKRHPNRTYTQKQLVKKLLGRYSLAQINEAIKRLYKKEQIFYEEASRSYKWGGRKRSDTYVEGRVDMTASGALFVVSEALAEDVFVSEKHTMQAMHKDKVRVQLFGKRKGRRPEGEVVDIIERHQHQFIGKIEKVGNYAFFIPSKKCTFDIFIPSKWLMGATHQDKVIVRVVDWNPAGKNPKGKVVDVLGEIKETSDFEMQSILINRGFNTRFPMEVIDEVKQLSSQISQVEIDRRSDFRKVPTFTIDPDDAKDFDDALSVRYIDDKQVEVGVHIADVSHYVRPESDLDKEAYQRSTSVYLPDRVCPMLPEYLSNELCSLRPLEEKLTYSVIFEFDIHHKLIHFRLEKTIIQSDKRFTYQEAQEILDKGEGLYHKELNTLNQIAKKYRRQRFDNGAIKFNSSEVKFILDDKGHPTSLFIKERKDTHLLVEDFMLMANNIVAKFMDKADIEHKRIPFVYRVHDEPSEEKLFTLSQIAKRFGYDIRFKDAKQTAFALNDFFGRIAGRPEQILLEQLGIRAMSKACYTRKNIGHYGLALSSYTHFTSPIRRYPDILVHRILFDYIHKVPTSYDVETLDALCRHTSLMEREAIGAEREAIKYKQVEYLQDKIGQSYIGIISGVVSYGFFVEIVENKCEGFVGINQFKEDTFVYEAALLRLSGTHSKRIFDIGDMVEIEVCRADLKTRKIDFEYVDTIKR